MDAEILETPKLSEETNKLMEEANLVYQNNFDGNIWFGRCIFLSWYCKIGTCTFCFRSTQKHKIQNPAGARRSIASVLSEALMIQGFNWRLEFLTGGYEIFPHEEMVKISKSVEQALGEKIWLNVGFMDKDKLKNFKDSTQGVVASLETINPELHKKVCPDKPMQPYFTLLDDCKDLGYKRSMTFIVGLGEVREDFELLKDFIEKNPLDRITIYALRPVKGTDFTSGPNTEDLVWWISKIRIAFPKLEIIVGTARHRIKEISLLVKAGCNAITKLPATNIFNTKDGLEVQKQVESTGRKFISLFSCEDVYKLQDWDALIEKIDVDSETKEKVKENLKLYLDKFVQNYKSLKQKN